MMHDGGCEAQAERVVVEAEPLSQIMEGWGESRSTRRIFTKMQVGFVAGHKPARGTRRRRNGNAREVGWGGIRTSSCRNGTVRSK